MTYTPPEQPSSPLPASSSSGSYSTGGGGYQPSAQYGFDTPANPSQTLSLWGLILSISGVVIPIFLNSIAGGVLSGIGLAKEPLGKVKAIWGLVLAGVGLVWGFVFWLVVLPMIVLIAFSNALIDAS